MRKHEPSSDRMQDYEAYERLARIDEKLAEIERLDRATQERTRNWPEQCGLTGKYRI